MGQDIRLTASDNFQLGAYRADPSGSPKGAVVVIQEIFGVNHHIRSVCDRLAKEGYVAIAPSIFDRTSPNFQSGYSSDEIAEARKFVASPDWEAMLRDTQAAIDAARNVGPVGIIGFCLGGSIAFVAATRLSGLKAAIGYYGGAVVRFAEETPKVPTHCISARRMPAFPSPMSRPSSRNAPTSRSSSIRAPSMASIATSGRATTRPAPTSPGRAAWSSSRRI